MRAYGVASEHAPVAGKARVQSLPRVAEQKYDQGAPPCEQKEKTDGGGKNVKIPPPRVRSGYHPPRDRGVLSACEGVLFFFACPGALVTGRRRRGDG